MTKKLIVIFAFTFLNVVTAKEVAISIDDLPFVGAVHFSKSQAITYPRTGQSAARTALEKM